MAGFINLTPHEIKILENGAVKMVIPPNGKSLRIACEFVEAYKKYDVTMYRAEYGDFVVVENANTDNRTIGLPPHLPEFIYIVSGQCLEALRDSNRRDFAAPGELIRDEKGQPIGCKGLKVL